MDSVSYVAFNADAATAIVQRNTAAIERFIMLLANILRALRSWRKFNASLRELNRLGDRELADIGISRSDIPRIAWDNSQH